MKLLQSSGGRRQGLEYAVGGSIVLVFTYYLLKYVFIAFLVYGGYRLIVSKSYPDGIFSVVVGVLLIAFVGSAIGSTLIAISYILGAIMLVYGIYRIVSPKEISS